MEKLLERLAALDGTIDALLQADELTDEQRTEHDKLQADRTALVARIGREEGRLARASERQALTDRSNAARVAADRAAATVVRGGRTDADPPTVNRPPVPRGGDGAALATGILPNSFCGVPNDVRHWGALRGQHGGEPFGGSRVVTLTGTDTVVNLTAEQRAYRFGMWMLGALSRQHPAFGNTEACIKANAWINTNMPGVNAYVTSTDSSGYQFLIPPEFSRDIIDLREQYGVARRLLKMEPMVSDKKMIPRRQSGLTAYWVSEGGVITPSNKVWNDVELIARDLTAISVVSAQVNADTIVPWAADIADEIAYAFSLAEDNAAFIGDGTSTYGKITGIAAKLKSPTYSDGYASQGLVTATGTGWGGITLANLQTVIGRLPQYADSKSCTFVSHRTFFYQVISPLLTALGGVNLTEATSGTNQASGDGYAARPLVLGYPWTFAQVMPSTNASAQVPVYFGDISKGAAFGDRQGPQIAFSDQGYVAGVSLFERNLLGIRGTERVDINVHDVGTSNTGLPASTAGPICGLLTG